MAVASAIPDNATIGAAGAGVLEPPFGHYALPAPLERLRRFGAGLGRSGAARRVASAIRRVCLLGRPDPVDIAPFPGQRSRLYPRDNLSEKRVFGAPQFWDWAERAALARAMAAAPPPFHFVDAGANVGLYSLAVRSQGPMRGLAVEPDAENLRRLRDNLAASGAAEITVAPVALAAEPGSAHLVAAANRGEISLGTGAEGGEIPTLPLLDLLRETGFGRVDALKIDIEGMEAPVLRAFLTSAPLGLRPRLVVIEAQRGAETEALALLRRAGYVERERTKMNVILAAPEGGWPAKDETGKADG